MIVGLISSYREGALIEAAIRSALVGCDSIAVFEGPVGSAPERGAESVFPHHRNFPVKRDSWASDAAKRTMMLEYAGRFEGSEPVWGLWLDGDEVLLWPELLRDWIARAELEGDEQNAVGGFPIRLVEMDGSVALCFGKLIRLDLIERYEVSSYQVRLRNGMLVALPNVPHWNWQNGGTHEGARPPLQGEPHLLHRSILREPERAELRLHEPERAWFEKAVREQGLPS